LFLAKSQFVTSQIWTRKVLLQQLMK
jgi:hypothetical protein